MTGNASVWEPTTKTQISGNTKAVEELIEAAQDQILFDLLTFEYVVGTGALEVHKNGLLLTKGKQWQEVTSSSFVLTDTATLGDQVVASGKVGITGTLGGGGVTEVIAGTNISVNNADPTRPIVSTAAKVTAVIAGANINVDATDPANPVVSSTASGAACCAKPLRDTPELIAHRGFRGVNVENTLHSIINSLYNGADSTEFDVQTSAEGTPYVFHDTTVNALTNGTGTFTALTDSYIDSLTYTAANGTMFEGIGIPLLSTVIEALSVVSGHFYPEIKDYSNVSDIETIVNIVKASGMSKRCTWQSFVLSDILTARDIDPECSFGYLVSGSLADMEDAVDNIENETGTFLLLAGYPNVLANPSIVTYAKSRGVDIGVWTVPTLEEYLALLRIGVFRIMSDYNYRGF